MSSPLTPYFRIAVDNIATLGDTDVFPFPPENHVFFDRPDDVVALLDELHKNFANWRDDHPPVNESALAMVGYTAFRWVTQVDPLWNAYLLGLVISLADDIEASRIPVANGVVFSYRYKHNSDDHHLFSDGAWRAFNDRSLELAQSHPYVLICDIADFYARIYHHRLENSLLFVSSSPEIPKRIIKVLTFLSGGTSYGLPVGGPAARILSELLLNRVDRLLASTGITFCRFADDYHIFTDTREHAYDALRFMTEKLLQNEGLTLQRAKTRIVSSRDFRAGSDFVQEDSKPTSESEDHSGEDVDDHPVVGEADRQAKRSFLALSLRYDPYSPTAKEDYETLRDQIEQFDILGMLASEVAKSRIHTALTRRLLQAIRYLEPEARDAAARTLTDHMDVLSPVLPNVLRALTDGFSDLSEDAQGYVVKRVREVVADRRYYASVPVNLGYALRLLGEANTEENQQLLAQLFDDAPHFIQRDIVVIMARWRAHYWLSDRRLQYSRLHPWPQRALLLASFVLADEGNHWRRAIAGQLSPFDSLVLDWAKQRSATSTWEIPL